MVQASVSDLITAIRRVNQMRRATRTSLARQPPSHGVLDFGVFDLEFLMVTRNRDERGGINLEVGKAGVEELRDLGGVSLTSSRGGRLAASTLRARLTDRKSRIENRRFGGRS